MAFGHKSEEVTEGWRKVAQLGILQYVLSVNLN